MNLAAVDVHHFCNLLPDVDAASLIGSIVVDLGPGDIYWAPLDINATSGTWREATLPNEASFQIRQLQGGHWIG